jgi:clan AA aspartic protease (TIGR02281 family)
MPHTQTAPPRNVTAPLRRALQAMLLAATSTGIAAAPEPCKLQQLKMPVQLVERRPVAQITLNGTEAQMLVDSGAFFSVLSKATATQLKLPLGWLPTGMQVRGHTGEIEMQRTRVEKLGLLGANLPNVEFLVGGNELGAGIDGIIGRNILSLSDTEYDLARGEVKLSFPKGDCEDGHYAHWAGEAPVIVAPLQQRSRNRNSPALLLRVKVNGVNMTALLDTGAPSTSLSLRAAGRAGIEESQMQRSGFVGGAGAGRARTWTATVASIEIATQRLNDSRLTVSETSSEDHDMIIGLDYFLAHRIYISKREDKLYATWNGQSVFPSGSGKAGPLDTRMAALPLPLDPQDADALARRGAASLAAGQLDSALDDLNRATTLAPTVADHFFTRARVQLAKGNLSAARADVDEALRLSPALEEARLMRARFLAAPRGDHSAAQQDLALLDAQLPPSSHLRLEMGRLFDTLRLVPQALYQYGLWIDTHEQDAKLADAQHARCLLRLRTNEALPLALKDCEAAADSKSALPQHRDTVGWAYLRIGDDKTALRRFERATRNEPSAVALYGRGLAHQRLGSPELGERDLARARELTPRIEEQLQRLGLLLPPPQSPPQSPPP